MKNPFENMGKAMRKATIGAVLLTGLAGAPKESNAQQKDIELNKNKTEVKNENKYNSAYYTPGSKEYSPLKIYKDFSQLFHLESIKFDTVGLAQEKANNQTLLKKYDDYSQERNTIDSNIDIVRNDDIPENDTLIDKYLEEMWAVKKNLMKKQKEKEQKLPSGDFHLY